VRQILAGLASIPLALVVSHVSSRIIDVPWGSTLPLPWRSLAIACCSRPDRFDASCGPDWEEASRGHCLGRGAHHGRAGGAGACSSSSKKRRLLRNHVRNGGFEKGRTSGKLLSVWRRGISWVLDTNDVTPEPPHYDSTTAAEGHDGGGALQRITWLRQGPPTPRPSGRWWSRRSEALFLTADREWTDRTYVENQMPDGASIAMCSTLATPTRSICGSSSRSGHSLDRRRRLRELKQERQER